MASAKPRFRHCRNESFVCAYCGRRVRPLNNGSCRNHCPYCLHSIHLDNVPGDRESLCGGLMECVAVQQDATRSWMLVHRCSRCGALRRNRAALGDPVQPDRFDVLLRVAGAAAGQSHADEPARGSSLR